MRRQAALVLPAVMFVAACRTPVPEVWHADACEGFVRLNEGIELEGPEEVAGRNVAEAGRGYQRHEVDVWLDRMKEFTVHMTVADDLLATLNVDCGSPLRQSVKS